MAWCPVKEPGKSLVDGSKHGKNQGFPAGVRLASLFWLYLLWDETVWAANTS